MKISNELKVGALTVVGLVTLILGFYYLKGVDLFSRTKHVYVVLEDAAGIVPANPVAMHGKQIGKVRTVSFKETGKYRVVFDLSIDKAVDIPQGSIVRIVELDLLGNKELRIIMPDEFSGNIAAKDTLYGEVKGNLFASLEDQLSPIMDKATPLVSNVDSLVVSVNQLLKRNQEAIDESLAGLQATMKNFEAISRRVDALLASQTENIEGILTDARVLTGTLAANSGRIDSILANLNTFSGNLSSVEIEPLVASAKSSLEALDELLTALNEAEGTLGKLVYDDAIANGLDSTLVSINALIQDLMENPKRYVSFSLIERKDKK